MTSARFSDWESDVYEPAENSPSGGDNFFIEIGLKFFDFVYYYPWLILILLILALFYVKNKYVNSTGEIKKVSAHFIRTTGIFLLLIIWFIVCIGIVLLTILWINRLS